MTRRTVTKEGENLKTPCDALRRATHSDVRLRPRLCFFYFYLTACNLPFIVVVVVVVVLFDLTLSTLFPSLDATRRVVVVVLVVVVLVVVAVTKTRAAFVLPSVGVVP